VSDDDDDRNRAAILARRSRYIALALLGTTTAVNATACACLEPLPPPDAGVDAGPGDAGPSDAGPSEPGDSGADGS